MRGRATTDAPADTGAATAVEGAFEGEDVPHDPAGPPPQAMLASGADKRGRKRLAVWHADGMRWLLLGLGARDRFDGERARTAAATALGRANELGAKTLGWELPRKVGDEIASAV